MGSASPAARAVSPLQGDLGELDYSDLIERVPLMAQVNALDHTYLAVLHGVTGNRVPVADPTGGNGTMTIDKFQACGLTSPTFATRGIEAAKLEVFHGVR